MPTIPDLRRALERLEDQAPDPGPTRTAVERRTSRLTVWSPRTTPLLAAAVAIVIAAAAALLVTRWSTDAPNRPAGPGSTISTAQRDPARPTSPPVEVASILTTWFFDVTPVDGEQLVREEITALSQRGELRRADGSAPGVAITFYQPGAFDPTTVPEAQSVTVGSAPGYFTPSWSGTGGATLVWAASANDWLRIDGYDADAVSGGDPQQILAYQQQLAARVTTGASGQARVPFTLSYLPDSLRLREYHVHDGTFEVGFSDAERAGRTVLQVYRATVPPDGSVGAYPPGREQLTVQGRRATFGPSQTRSGTSLTVDLGDQSMLVVWVSAEATSTYPKAVLVKIVEQGDFSPSLTDPSTWIAASVAIP